MMLCFSSATAKPNKVAQNPGPHTPEQIEQADMGATPTEQRLFAADAVVETSINHDVLLHWLAAQRAGDPERVTCVSERLDASHRLRNAVANARDALDEALAMLDGELALHHLRKISVAIIRSRQLRAEADQCMHSSAKLPPPPPPLPSEPDPTSAPPSSLWWDEM